MFKRYLFVVVIVVLAVVLSSCSSGLELGHTGTAKKNIVVVIDYNLGSYKPKCTIERGNSVRVVDFSTLNLGSGERQPLVELSSSNGCRGWAFDDSSLSNKIK